MYLLSLRLKEEAQLGKWDLKADNGVLVRDSSHCNLLETLMKTKLPISYQLGGFGLDNACSLVDGSLCELPWSSVN